MRALSYEKLKNIDLKQEPDYFLAQIKSISLKRINMKIKIYAERNVQEQWNEIWKIDNLKRNMEKLTYPEYWPIFEKYITKSKRILEAGCGLGKWMNYFHTRGYNITGIDYSDFAVNELKKYNSKFKVFLGDVTNIPFKDCSFDVYLSFGVLEHLENDTILQKAVSEIYRVLTGGGIAIISIPYLNIANWIFALQNHRGAKKNNGCFFEYNYTIGEFLSYFDLKNKRV